MSNVFYLPISLRRAAKLNGFYIEAVTMSWPLLMWCYIAPNLLWLNWQVFLILLLSAIFILKRYLTKRFKIYQQILDNNQLFINQHTMNWQYHLARGDMRILSMRINRYFALLSIKEQKRQYLVVILAANNTLMDYHKLRLYRRYALTFG